MANPSIKLGFGGLTALVFGMMVGAGIFNIPQNMAVAAAPGAVLIGWLVTALGMLLLVFTFKALAESHPELDAGIYQYAQKGFGPFAGFNIAWGYWLCTCFANVAYAVMLNDTLAAFFPALHDHGLPTMIFGTALIWVIFFVVSSGMRTARAMTIVLAAVKFSVIALMVVLLSLCSKLDLLSLDFWGNGSLNSQVNDTMMVTIWCFIGIEGAVIMSGRARRASDVGRAGVAGFFAAWILYVLVSMLCYGIMPQAQLANLKDPSVAFVLRYAVGDWAYWLVIVSVIISLTGGWLAWSLICAEVPYSAARVNILPRRFLNLKFGLAVSSLVMQAFFILVLFAHDVYLTALEITSMMILPAYLVCGLFLAKVARGKMRILGIACAIFCLWTIYAGGIDLMLLTLPFYAVGLPLYRRRPHLHGGAVK